MNAAPVIPRGFPWIVLTKFGNEVSLTPNGLTTGQNKVVMIQLFRMCPLADRLCLGYSEQRTTRICFEEKFSKLNYEDKVKWLDDWSCHNCGLLGHFKKNCTSPIPSKGNQVTTRSQCM